MLQKYEEILRANLFKGISDKIFWCWKFLTALLSAIFGAFEILNLMSEISEISLYEMSIFF